MSSRIRRPLVLLALAPLCATLWPAVASAQRSFGGTPPSFSIALDEEAPTRTVVDTAARFVRFQDASTAKNEPFRFGHPFAVDYSLENSGVWETLENGSRLWRLNIRSVDALSLNLVFGTYHLPDGAELFLYDEARTTVLGSFNALNNRATRTFATQLIHSDSIVVEYLEPNWVEFPGELQITEVVHGYKDIKVFLQKSGGTGKAQCERSVTCPEGDPWQDQINAVTRIIRSGVMCSGSLLNNTAQDGTQYMITAEHCGNMTNAVFYFKYETPNCLAGTANAHKTVQGAINLVTDQFVDYRFIELVEPIPAAYEPYFAGWDRSGAIPTNTVTIHHPGGSPKKISFDDDPPAILGNDWHILQWDLGVTEGGSSGCPLYNPSGRFIGHLWGGAAACGYPYDDYYARLDSYWNAVGSYLDPLSTGATILNGMEPNPCVTPIAYGNPEIGSGGTAATIGSSGGDPQVGNLNFAVTLQGGLPNALAVCMAGQSAQVTNTPFGTILVGDPGLTWQWFFTDGAGGATTPINIVPALIGQTWHVQYAIRDPGFGGGAQVSDALIVTFCH